MVTNQTRFQRIIDALKRGDAAAARADLVALSGSISGDKERHLFDHLSMRYAAVFGAEPEQRNPTELPVEKICGRLHRFPDKTCERRAEGGTRFDGVVRRSFSTEPLVTIITVVYNNVDTVRQCIDSVFRQTYKNIEYIIIDGGSDDGTVSIIEEYAGKLDYYLSEPDDGLYNAMNKGLLLAKGEYIAFLNADDFYLSEAVAISVSGLQKTNADFSYAGFFYMDEHGVAVIADEGREWRDAMLIDGIMGGHETCFIHRETYELIGGYDESFRSAADYHWFTRAFKRGLRAHRIKKNILVMRLGGVSSNPELELSENKRLLAEHFGEQSDEMLDRLYDLKYYRHWHGNTLSDRQLVDSLSAAFLESKQLRRSLAQTVYNRTRGIQGLQKPADSPRPGKLKIAIALNYMTGTSGGAERIAAEAARELSNRGHAVTFVSCHGAAGEPYYAIDPSIPFIDLAIDPYKQEYYHAGAGISLEDSDWNEVYFEELEHKPTHEDVQRWASHAHLWRTQVYCGFFRKHEFDVVVSHMPSTFPYTLLAMKGVPSPPKQIACLHNAPKFKFYSSDYPAESDTDRHMRLASLGRADRIGILFEEFRQQMPEHLQDRCRPVTNFISPDIVASVVDESETRPPQKVILSVGRLAKQKDHQILLSAFAIIRRDHPDWSLNIYGEGPLQAELNSLCEELGLKSEEIFLGTRRDIDGAYRTADIFAFPSLFEGFGLTALEAMSHGLPVVAYRECEGVKYLVKDGENGLLATRTAELDSLVSALERLIADQEFRASLGQKARAAADTYSVQRHVDNLEDLFERDLELTHEPTECTLPSAQTDSKLLCAVLSTYTEGGAGIAAQRLQKGLQDAGHDAMMLGFSQHRDQAVLSFNLTPEMQSVYDAGQRVFSGDRVEVGSAHFSSSRAGLTADQISILSYFDVVNLHWIENLITPEGMNEIARLGKPIVWTLHDMKPLTGGCHYSGACRKYESTCEKCPQLASQIQDYPGEVLALKQAAIPENVVIVTPSRWLADCARNSRVFANNRIEVISNGIDLSDFRPRDADHARSALGLPLDKKLLLFTCHDHSERRKGFAEFLETVEILSQFRSDIELVTLGHGSPELQSLKLPYTALGFISDPKRLSLVYSAVDATVLPTLEDNLPNVILESVACGTPVAAFDSGGVRDAVIDGVTGFLAPRGDCAELAQSIIASLEHDGLQNTCRQHALNHFSQELQAHRYAALFADVLKSNKQAHIPNPSLFGQTAQRVNSLLLQDHVD